MSKRAKALERDWSVDFVAPVSSTPHSWEIKPPIPRLTPAHALAARRARALFVPVPPGEDLTAEDPDYGL